MFSSVEKRKIPDYILKKGDFEALESIFHSLYNGVYNGKRGLKTEKTTKVMLQPCIVTLQPCIITLQPCIITMQPCIITMQSYIITL